MTDNNVLQLTIQPREIVETIDGHTVRFVWDVNKQHWNIILAYTEHKEITRTAADMNKARKLVDQIIKMLHTLDAEIGATDEAAS